MAVKPDDGSRARATRAFASDVARRDVRPAPSPGDTLPPTPLAALVATGGADLIVLSTDAQLIDTATRASHDQLPVRSVASWKDLEAALGVTRRAVVLVDAELLGAAASARIAALDVYSHKVVTLVAADRVLAQGLMGLLSERKVHRLLIKPPALGITRLLIDSAVSRCLRLADAEVRREPTVEGPSRAAVQRPRLAAPIWVFATAAAALLAGVAVIASVSAWWRSSPDEGVPQSQAAQLEAPAATEAAPEHREQDLGPRHSAPRSLDDYLAILAANPTDAAARQQVDAIVGALYAEAETALLANSYATATAVLADVRRADPASSRLQFLEAQLERARAAASARPVIEEPQAPAAVANAELASLVTIARARIQRGALLEPGGDSALEYLNRAERIAPRGADVSAVRDELAAALLTGAQDALAKGDVARAGAFTRQAARSGADAAQVAQLESELARRRVERAAQRHAEWLALAEARMRQGALVDPPEDNARHYLATLQNEAPQHEGLDAAWTAFIAAMQDRIAIALAARDWTQAEEGLAALSDAPNGAAAGESLQTALTTAKLEERFLAVAAPASELELLERVALIYPPEAARDGIEGWVDVEFAVDVTGQPRDFRVIAAEPQGRFEDAALAALAKYRYRPFTHDGRPFARLLRLRIRFALQ